MRITWTQITPERWDDMVGVVPPEMMRGGAFLMGEPADHRRCSIKGEIAPSFHAFLQTGEGDAAAFYEITQPLTVREFLYLLNIKPGITWGLNTHAQIGKDA